MDDVVLSHDQAVKAAKMFAIAIAGDDARNENGDVALSRATELLRDAFATIKLVDDPAGIGE